MDDQVSESLKELMAREKGVTPPPSVSLVTRIRNRRDHIIHTLPTWLQYPFTDIVLVDWTSTDGDLREYVTYLGDERVRLVISPGHSDFNRGAAWNLGIAQAACEWVLLLDCDVMLTENPLACTMLNTTNPLNFYRIHSDFNVDTGQPLRPNLYGCGLVNKAQWGRVGGFLEMLKGWGGEDAVFWKALVDAGFNEVFLPFDPFEHIKHGDEYRVREHGDLVQKRVTAVQNITRSLLLEEVTMNTSFDGYEFDRGRTKRLQHCHQSYRYRVPEQELESLLNSEAFTAAALAANPSNQLSDVYGFAAEWVMRTFPPPKPVRPDGPRIVRAGKGIARTQTEG